MKDETLLGILEMQQKRIKELERELDRVKNPEKYERFGRDEYGY